VKKPPQKNLSASVRQRLLNNARETGRPFNEVLQYFGMERFLYRLSASALTDKFVLQRALLFRVLDTPQRRPTMDIDFLGCTDNTPENIAKTIRQICATKVEADGLDFDLHSVVSMAIKEDTDHAGVRTRFQG